MIAMTTSSSMSVNACLEFFFMAKSLNRPVNLPQVWRAGNQLLGGLSLSPCGTSAALILIISVSVYLYFILLPLGVEVLFSSF